MVVCMHGGTIWRIYVSTVVLFYILICLHTGSQYCARPLTDSHIWIRPPVACEAVQLRARYRRVLGADDIAMTREDDIKFVHAYGCALVLFYLDA